MLTLLTPLIAPPGFHYATVVPKAIFFRSLVFAAVVPLLWLIIHRQLRVRRDDPVLLALLGFVAVAAISAATGVSPTRSIYGDVERMWGVFTWFHLVLYYVLLRTALDDGGWRRFLDGAIVVGAIVTLLGLAEVYGDVVPIPGIRSASGGRPVSTTGNPGFLSAFLLFAGSLTVVRAVTTTAIPARALLWTLAAAEGWLFVNSGGRAALLGLGVATVLGAAWFVLRGDGRSRKAAVLMALAAGIAALGAVIPMSWWRVVPVLNRLIQLGGRDDSRFEVWRGALRAVGDRPLLGTGLENANVALNATLSAELYNRIGTRNIFWDRIHNVFLEALVTTGILGFLCYTALWIAIFGVLLRAYRRRLLAPVAFAGLTAAVVAYLFHLLFWFEDWNSFPVALAVVGFAAHRSSGGPILTFGVLNPKPPAHPRLILALSLVTIAIGLNLWSVRPMRGAWHAARASSATSVVEQVDAWEKAIDLAGVQGVQYLFEMTRDIRTAPLATPAEQTAVRRGISAAIEALTAEISRDPVNDLLYAHRSDLLRTSLRLDPSQQVYLAGIADVEAAISLAPIRLDNYHRLANLHTLTRNPESALRALDRAVAIRADFANTHQLAAFAHVQADDPVAAFESGVRAVRAPDAGGDLDFVVALADTLVDLRQPILAAELILARLEHRYAAPSTTAEPQFISPFGRADRPLAARLPLDFIRAGDAEGARKAAVFLRRGAPDSAPAVTRFLQDLNDHGATNWLPLREIPLADWRR